VFGSFWLATGQHSGITAIANILRSESTGSIHGTSSRPDTPPAIRFNFLSAALDREVALEATRITHRIMTAPAMKDIVSDEIAPGVRSAYLIASSSTSKISVALGGMTPPAPRAP